ncbi:NUDIX hydrolase [Shimia biformata]|uniref:NUDIX hydrolase n=1 Tax=Shimia biformata TaxID=1294299 RepID=UPI00194FE636|nr:NUDIX hydrolase [Shimia biformata]
MTPSLAFQRGQHSQFRGAKMALFIGPHLVTILRDEVDTIPWPGHWDLVGGGREGLESAADCAIRECHEEMGLVLDPGDLTWARRYERTGRFFWFFAAHLPQERQDDIRFGDEGQRFELVTAEAYLTNPGAIPRFQSRLSDYLDGKASHL